MVRAPAAPSESLKPESSPEEPPEPVDLEPEEDVVMEPLAVGPAGVVPLLWGKGAIAAGVASGAVAMSWPAASEEAAAIAVSAAVSAGATASLTDEVTGETMLDAASTEADSTIEETTLVAASGVS